MTDYIERQAALDALGELPLVWTEDDYYSLGARNQYDLDRLAIETIPSADVEPVRHGRWIEGGYACGETEWICSECGFSEWRTSNSRMKFCMNCGARMDGEQDYEITE